MSMSLRKKNPTQGAVGNLMSRMETLQVSEAAGNTAGDSSKDSKDGGLSAGATAGITIGVTLCVGILVIAIFAMRRRKRSPMAVNGDHSEYQTFNNS